MTPEDRHTLAGIQADVQELRLCLQVLMEEHQLMLSLLQLLAVSPDALRGLSAGQLHALLEAKRPALRLSLAAMLAKRRTAGPCSTPPNAQN